MKLFKKTMAMLLCLMLAVSGCVLSVSAAESETEAEDTSLIYFEVPSFWENCRAVYCHIEDGEGKHLASWQSKKSRCTQVEGNLYSYDTARVGGLEEGTTYLVIMSLDIGAQTYEATMTTACLGDTLYCDGTEFTHPADPERTATAAYWKNTDPSQCGPVMAVNCEGDVVGTACKSTAEDVFYEFLTSGNFRMARETSGKNDQVLIDEIIASLGLSVSEALSVVNKADIYDLEWIAYDLLESIEIAPITLTEGLDGHFSFDYNSDTEKREPYYCYYYGDHINYTITMSDGSIKKGEGKIFEHNGDGYSLDFSDDQSIETPWAPGNVYEVKATLFGKQTTFPVTIEKSPVKEVTVEQVTRYEGIDGYYYYDSNMDEYDSISPKRFVYEFDDIECTVYFNDGTVKKSENGEVEYKGDTYHLEVHSEQQSSNVWEVGNTYEATALMMGKMVDFPVSIEENPVEELTLVKGPEQTVFDIAERRNIEGTVIRIDYNDGTFEEVTLGKFSPGSDCNEVYVERFDRNFRATTTRINEDNKYSVVLLCRSVELEGTLKSSLPESLAISEENDELFIEITYEDGSKKNMKALYKDSLVLVTDNGTYYAEFREDPDGGYYLEMILGYEMYLQSNTLNPCKWWEANRSDRLLGDANGDNTVNVKDATEIQKYAAGLIDFSEDVLAVADMNDDGAVNVRDATAIQKQIAGIE